jgi:hypothetical protein
MRQLGDYIIVALFNAVLRSKNEFHGDMYTVDGGVDLFWYIDEVCDELVREDDDIFLLIKNDITIIYSACTDPIEDDKGQYDCEVRIHVDFNGFVTGIDYTELKTDKVKTIEVEK